MNLGPDGQVLSVSTHGELREAASSAAYRLLKRHAPRRYVRLIAHRGADFHPIARDCDLVIAGVPGCANSFMREAILSVNPDLRICSHSHVWTDVEDGVRWKLPVLLLIREPVAAAASRLTRFEADSPGQALQEYIEFYSHALPYLDDVVIADFKETVESPAAVIDCINVRYGTNYALFSDQDQSAQARVEHALSRTNGALPSQRRGPNDRTRVLEQAHLALAHPSCSQLLTQCEALYDRIREVAQSRTLVRAMSN